MIPAASPATKANKIGAVGEVGERKNNWIIEIEHFDHTSWTWIDMDLQLSHEVRDYTNPTKVVLNFPPSCPYNKNKMNLYMPWYYLEL